MLFLFLFIITLLLGSAHFYIWFHLVYQTTTPGFFRNLGAISLLLITAILILFFTSTHSISLKLQEPLAWVAYLWLGLLFYLLITLAASDLLTGIGRLLQIGFFTTPGWQLARATICLLLSLCITAFATANAIRAPVITKYEITIPGLPDKFDGMTIAQLSDLHISAILEHKWLQARIRETMALKADLIAITGDLVDGPVNIIKNELEPLRSLTAPMGVYFVTGNHEYISDGPGWAAYLPSLGLRVLRNEHVTLTRDDQQIYLVGVDDLSASKYVKGHGTDLSKATDGIPAQATIIGLAHQPNVALEATGHGIKLLLTGHTHGGQIWPFDWAVKLAQPWTNGLYKVNDMQLVVSQGTGFWGPPMRIGSLGEILFITLKK